MNKLYYGDCLTVMQGMPHDTVDLVYLDPPFNSNRQYNAIYKDETGQELPDQIDAFCDMWELNEETDRLIRSMPVLIREAGLDDELAEFWRVWVNALRGTQPRLLAYLSYMVPRLLQMRRVLKSTGSVYYHCDDTASHYIKVIMDGIFGHEQFRNDVIWRRATSHNDGNRFGRIADHILFYTKEGGGRWTWNPLEIATEKSPEDIEASYPLDDRDGRGRYRAADLTGAGRTKSGESGQPWRRYDVGARGRHWAPPIAGEYAKFIERQFIPGYRSIIGVHDRLDALDEAGLIRHPERGFWPGLKRYASADIGYLPQNIILDPIGFTNYSAGKGEYMGYPTQKPLGLLEKIIKVSSNEGDLVLDPFAGCGTTMEAAQRLERHWIGIDIAIHAVKRVSKLRLQDHLGLSEPEDFVIEGVPRDVEGAHSLWERDRYHFQKWAVEQADGFVTSNRTVDGGIDGRLYFAVDHDSSLESMVIEVKGGKTNIADVRSLRGVLEREEALMAGLIILDELGSTQERNFRREMASAGHEVLWGNEYPRMQMLTVQELLDGKRFQTPTVMGKHSQEPRMPGLPA